MPTRVIVLGGGVAGMSAAHELIERGFEVLVLESGDLAGGKARSIPVVDDGDGGLECWVDPAPNRYWIASRSRGRCPGGVNSRTGRLHRVVWAHPVTRIAWEEDNW